MKRRTEGEVVDRGELLVDARDEVVLDRRDRQGAGRGVGTDELFVVRRARQVRITAIR